MNNEIIALLLILQCHTVISMKIPLQQPDLSLFKELPQDLTLTIVDLIKSKQWWYLKTIFEPDDRIDSICYNHNGTLLATASSHTIRIFDVQTDTETHSFHHKYLVKSIRFNHNDTLLAIGSCDKNAHIFDLQNHQETHSFHHDNWVNSVCFNHNSTLLATASSDTVRIFNIKTNIEIQSFQHDSHVHSISFNRNSTLLTTGSSDNKTRIFAHHNNYTLEQLILKNALITWLLIERPNKKIDTFIKLLRDVASKHCYSYDELIKIWKTLSEDMQNAIWRTMHYKIQTYGKNDYDKNENNFCPIQ